MRKPIETGQRADRSGELAIPGGYVYSAVVILAVTGIAMLFAAGVRLRVLGEGDVLLGFSNGTVLLLAGLLHLVVAVFIFAARNLSTQGVVLLWLGLNHLVYRVGLVWMGVAGSPPILEAVGLKFGIRPTSLDAFWKGIIAYLTIGSALVLFCEWRRTKREQAEEFMKNYEKKRRQLNPEDQVKPRTDRDGPR